MIWIAPPVMTIILLIVVTITFPLLLPISWWIIPYWVALSAAWVLGTNLLIAASEDEDE